MNRRVSMVAAGLVLVGCLAGVQGFETEVRFDAFPESSAGSSLGVFAVVEGRIGEAADGPSVLLATVTDSLLAALSDSMSSARPVHPDSLRVALEGRGGAADYDRSVDHIRRGNDPSPEVLKLVADELDVQYVMAVVVDFGSGGPGSFFNWGPAIGMQITARVWAASGGEPVWSAESRVSRDTGAFTFPNNREGREEMAGLVTRAVAGRLPL